MSGVVYYDANGVERFQPAELVILAANGIGTPRLLLNSASARFPAGLANSSGLVGENLMLHPWPLVFGYVEMRAPSIIAGRLSATAASGTQRRRPMRSFGTAPEGCLT